MFSVDTYLHAMKENLKMNSELLVENLKRVCAYNFADEVELLDFSAFMEPTRFELSVMMFSMDREANEVFSEDSAGFAGSEEVLPEVTYFQLDEKHSDEFFNFYEENEEEILAQEQNAVASWFRDCWVKACGEQVVELPAYFLFHAEFKSLELKTNMWIVDNDKWT